MVDEAAPSPPCTPAQRAPPRPSAAEATGGPCCLLGRQRSGRGCRRARSTQLRAPRRRRRRGCGAAPRPSPTPPAARRLFPMAGTPPASPSPAAGPPAAAESQRPRRSPAGRSRDSQDLHVDGYVLGGECRSEGTKHKVPWRRMQYFEQGCHEGRTHCIQCCLRLPSFARRSPWSMTVPWRAARADWLLLPRQRPKCLPSALCSHLATVRPP